MPIAKTHFIQARPVYIARYHNIGVTTMAAGTACEADPAIFKKHLAALMIDDGWLRIVKEICTIFQFIDNSNLQDGS